jgi:hypothetical protein
MPDSAGGHQASSETGACLPWLRLSLPLHATEGSSIGAAMRALPLGWATPVTATARRRELTIRGRGLSTKMPLEGAEQRAQGGAVPCARRWHSDVFFVRYAFSGMAWTC